MRRRDDMFEVCRVVVEYELTTTKGKVLKREYSCRGHSHFGGCLLGNVLEDPGLHPRRTKEYCVQLARVFGGEH